MHHSCHPVPAGALRDRLSARPLASAHALQFGKSLLVIVLWRNTPLIQLSFFQFFLFAERNLSPCEEKCKCGRRRRMRFAEARQCRDGCQLFLSSSWRWSTFVLTHADHSRMLVNEVTRQRRKKLPPTRCDCVVCNGFLNDLLWNWQRTHVAGECRFYNKENNLSICCSPHTHMQRCVSITSEDITFLALHFFFRLTQTLTINTTPLNWSIKFKHLHYTKWLFVPINEADLCKDELQETNIH